MITLADARPSGRAEVDRVLARPCILVTIPGSRAAASSAHAARSCRGGLPARSTVADTRNRPGCSLGDGEEVLGRVAADAVGALGVAQPGGEHADVDAGVVHRGHAGPRRSGPWRGRRRTAGARPAARPGPPTSRRRPRGRGSPSRRRSWGRTVPDTTVRNGAATYDRAMHDLGFRPFDADNHYYEAEDAFIRHIDPAMAEAVHAVGRRRTASSGCWSAGRSTSSSRTPRSTRSPSPAASRTTSGAERGRPRPQDDVRRPRPDRRAPRLPRPRRPRRSCSTSRGWTARCCSPRSASACRRRSSATSPRSTPRSRAFNRWLDDDWGFDRGDGRLYAAPMITLADAELAAAEVRPGARRGRPHPRRPSPARCPTATTATCRPATRVRPGVGAASPRPACRWRSTPGSAASASTARFWRTGGRRGGGGGFAGFKHAAFPLVAFQDRGISDTFAALICHGVLERFPDLRLASIENGAMWVPDLLRNLQDAHGKMPFAFKRAPGRAVPRAGLGGAVLRGRHGAAQGRHRHRAAPVRLATSRTPRACPSPTLFVKDIPTFDEAETKAIMRDNVLDLLDAAARLGRALARLLVGEGDGAGHEVVEAAGGLPLDDAAACRGRRARRRRPRWRR